MVEKFKQVLAAKRSFIKQEYGKGNIVNFNYNIYTFHQEEEVIQKHFDIIPPVTAKDRPILLQLWGEYKNDEYENYYEYLFVLNKDLDDDRIWLDGWSMRPSNEVVRDYRWKLQTRTYYFFDPNDVIRGKEIISTVDGVKYAYRMLREFSLFGKMSSLLRYEEVLAKMEKLELELVKAEQIKLKYWGYRSILEPREVAKEIQAHKKTRESDTVVEKCMLDLLLAYCYYKMVDYRLALHYLALFSNKELDDRTEWLEALDKVFVQAKSLDFLVGHEAYKLHDLRRAVKIEDEA